MFKPQRVFFIISAIAIVALGLAGYFYYQLRLERQSSGSAVNQQEVADLVAKVGALFVLPTGETPTIATVSDPEALKDQAFFDKAKKGDKVLIYAKAKKAVLYSVTLNKILEVTTLTDEEGNGTTPVVPQAANKNEF